MMCPKCGSKDNLGRYPDGHAKAGKKIKIKVGGNLERRKQALKDIDDVLKIFNLAKYMRSTEQTTGGIDTSIYKENE